MWYLVIMIFYFSNDPSINIITSKNFTTLDECETQEEYFNNDIMSYSEMCVHEDELMHVGYDNMTGHQDLVFRISD